MTTDNSDLDTARDRLRQLRAQAEAERHSGITGSGHNRRPGAAKTDRALRNRRARRRVAQHHRSA